MTAAPGMAQQPMSTSSGCVEGVPVTVAPGALPQPMAPTPGWAEGGSMTMSPGGLTASEAEGGQMFATSGGRLGVAASMAASSPRASPSDGEVSLLVRLGGRSQRPLRRECTFALGCCCQERLDLPSQLKPVLLPSSCRRWPC